MTHRHSILLVASLLAVTLAPAPRGAGAAPGGTAWKPSWEARIAPRGEPGETFILIIRPHCVSGGSARHRLRESSRGPEP